MEYGAIDLHKKESQIRIVTEAGAVIDRRVVTTRLHGDAARGWRWSRWRDGSRGSSSRCGVMACRTIRPAFGHRG